MSIYQRIVDPGVEPRVPVHTFTATLREFGRGRLTGAEAQAVIEVASGQAFTAEEVAEAQALLATITSAGNATAKLARCLAIDDCLILGENRAPGYSTVAELKTKLGV